MATKAVMVTDCPASLSEIPSSCAIGVSKLTGKNSTVIRQATQNATANTADQLGHQLAAMLKLFGTEIDGARLAQLFKVDIFHRDKVFAF